MLLQTGERAGTGVVVGDGTHILTTFSVLKNTRTGGKYSFATVKYDDGSITVGSVAATDELRDLAILNLTGEATKPALSLEFEGVPGLAETVAIVGYSHGVVGVPSARLGVVNVRADTKQPGLRFLETTAFTGPTSRGSPLISTNGEALGIIVEHIPLLEGEPFSGYAYALCMDDVRSAIEEMGVPIG